LGDGVKQLVLNTVRPPRRLEHPPCYVFNVTVNSLFAGLRFFGENSMLRLSLIDRDFFSAAFPAAVGLRVSLTFPAALTETVPLRTTNAAVSLGLVFRWP
jgi:hypothetical protein